MKPFSLLIYFFIIFLGIPNLCFAYIGPGAGVGLIAAIWAFGIAIVLSIVGIFYLPIKMLIKKWRHQDNPESDHQEQANTKTQIEKNESSNSENK